MADERTMDMLREAFGSRLQENAHLADYTTAHVGGRGMLVAVHDLGQLVEAVKVIQAASLPWKIIGSGANIVFSDKGYSGVIILNRAHNVRIWTEGDKSFVTAESGANFTATGRQAALRGFSGLEWAATVPGTVGGAIYGNAGAFGGVTENSLIEARVYDLTAGEQTWPREKFEYEYRSSNLKRNKDTSVIILSGTFAIEPSDAKTAMEKVKELTLRRKKTQPTGATMGSTFKNPPGDYAGRLIEAAGLKGYKLGGARMSDHHANFLINDGEATADEIFRLIKLVRDTVQEKSGVTLELEIELIGEFPAF